MTKWEAKSQKLFGLRNPGEAPRPDQQNSLNIITLVVAVACYIGLVLLGIVAELGIGEWVAASLIMITPSIIDALYGRHRQIKQQRTFYWQLFIARSSTYGYIAMIIVMILQRA